MNKHFLDLQLDKFKLLKVFSNMDTQSAIVAAIAISIISFLVTGFSNLCNYIYWSAYFTKFNIPLAYMDEAIIHENGIKYSVILITPLLILFWLLLGAIKNTAKKGFLKSKKMHEIKNLSRIQQYTIKIFKYLFSFFTMLVLVSCLVLLAEWISFEKYCIVFILFFELIIFIFWNISKTIFGKKYSFSQSKYYFIRIVGIIIVLYLILGNVYISGGLKNYRDKEMQRLQIINETDINLTLDDGDEIKSQLVLFETTDYYYVTDVTITKTDGLNVKIWGTDSYCFINKIDCSVKSVYARLIYIGGDWYQDSSVNKFAGLYVGSSLIFSLVFIPLLTIPMREDKKDKKANLP